MNTRDKAISGLDVFLDSNERCLLLTGTHQYEKHPLVLGRLVMLRDPSTILFRVNSMKNVGTILKDHGKTYQTGIPYRIGNHRIYIDSINSASWSRTPRTIDYALLYPIDSVCRIKNKSEIINDLVSRQCKKLFLVSWTDVHSYDWLKGYVDRHVVYDVEEEDPAYHQRVLDQLKRI